MLTFINNIISFLLPVIPKFIVRIFANKYIAGTKLKETINSIKKINNYNLKATVDILGEHTLSINESKTLENSTLNS